jgi:hypothetical protein
MKMIHRVRFPWNAYLFAVATLFSGPLLAGESGDLVSQIAISRPAHGINHAATSLDAPLNIDRRESLHLDLVVGPNAGAVRIEAPNGGRINHTAGPATLDLAKSKGHLAIDFEAGDNPGRYTIEITCGSSSKTIEMWAGPLPPQGKAGPSLSFAGRP